jgi:hypothetical protein
VRGVAIGIGVGIALVGAGLLAIAAASLVTGGDGTTAPAGYVGLMAVFAAMIWWGLQIAWPSLSPRSLRDRLLAWRSNRRALAAGPKPPVEPDSADRERAVLRLAEEEQGRVTVLEVAGRCNLTVDEATKLLDGLVLREIARQQVSEVGVLVYVFPGLLPGPGRAHRR